MNKTTTERRQFPRVTATFPIRIAPDFLGQTVDLSEAGLRFVLEKPLFLSKAQAKIELSPGESIDTEFKVIWNKHLIQNGKFTYGACFIRLKEKDINNLRDILIRTHSESIFKKINNAEDKKIVSHFWNNDFKEYMDKLTKTTILLDQGFNKEDGFNQVTDFNDTIVKKGDILENTLDNKIIIKRIKKTFRELCGPWVYKSKIVRHAFEKPRGYPGDYKLIEIIYDNQTLSQGIGYCYDRYLLNNAYAAAVRNRKDTMHRMLSDFINKQDSPNLAILNLACGSCREIKEIFVDHNFLSKKEIIFTLVDQDEEALNFSKEILKNSRGKTIYKFLQHNILDYSEDVNKYVALLGKQDMVYSIGLADYLPDRVLKNLLLFCFNLLKPKGKMIIAHKDISQYKPLPPDWWCDWTFYPRDEHYLLNLITKSGIKDFNIKIEREPSNIIFFLSIEKA